MLLASFAIYVLALAVTAMTAPAKRIYWPLYLPVVAAAAILIATRQDL